MAIAFVIALLAHALLLSLISWKRAPAPAALKRALEIRLLAPQRPVSDRPEPARPVSALPEPTAQAVQKEEITAPEPERSAEPTPPRRRFSPAILESARESVRGRQAPAAAEGPRSFSTTDFPAVAAAPDRFTRPPTLQRRFAQRASTTEYTDAEGNLVIRRVDPWGNVTCWRRRDVPGEGHGPMWYASPGNAC